MSTKIARLLPLQSWNFVDNPALRDILVRDYRELRKVTKALSENNLRIPFKRSRAVRWCNSNPARPDRASS